MLSCNSVPVALQNLVRNMPIKTLIYISWEPAPGTWLKLNSHGSVLSQHLAACGEVIRDASSQALRYFATNLGSCLATVAELWGALHALQLTWSLGHQHVILDRENSAVVISLLGG